MGLHRHILGREHDITGTNQEVTATRSNRFWSPYVASALLGLTLLATFFIAGRSLGASGAFSLATATTLHAAAPGFAARLVYFTCYFQSPAPLLDWNIFLILGVLAGALGGALLSRNFAWSFDRNSTMTVRTRFASALAGVGLGSLLFAAVFPLIKGFYLSSDMGNATLQKLLGVNHWVVIVLLVVIAGGMFAGLERLEKGWTRT